MSILFEGPNDDGYFGYEPVDGEAAEIIAGIAAGNAKAIICPHIRECHRRCMSIVNVYPENEDALIAKLFGALHQLQGVERNERYEEFGVAIQCDKHPECSTPFETFSLPRSLLQRDPFCIRDQFRELCARLDSQKPQ